MVHRIEPIAVRLRRPRSERGAILIIMALVMVTLLIFAALVVDIGYKREIRRQAQNSADAAALASANVLYVSGSADFNSAVSAVKTYAYSNFGTPNSDWVGCSDSSSLTYQPDSANSDSCISFDSSTHPTLVRVTMPNKTVPFAFGKIVGRSSATVTASAEALVKTQGTGPCGFCVIGSGTPYVGQNGDLTVLGDAGMTINGSGTTQHNGSANVSAQGGITMYNNGTYNGNFNPQPVTVPTNFADPLANYPVPDYSTLTAKPGCVGGGATPGIYSTIPTNCVLSPGLYVITGTTHISSGLINASAGVTLYLTCGSGTTPAACASGGQSGADLICSGNATIQINAPSTGPTQGMAIFMDRNNTGGLDCRGNGAGAIVGTIYAADGNLTMRGNGVGVDDYSLIVVKTANFNGNPSAFTSQYNHAQNVPVMSNPPTLVQ
jgi:Flp pilus assembly protein TadG